MQAVEKRANWSHCKFGVWDLHLQHKSTVWVQLCSHNWQPAYVARISQEAVAQLPSKPGKSRYQFLPARWNKQCPLYSVLSHFWFAEMWLALDLDKWLSEPMVSYSDPSWIPWRSLKSCTHGGFTSFLKWILPHFVKCTFVVLMWCKMPKRILSDVSELCVDYCQFLVGLLSSPNESYGFR